MLTTSSTISPAYCGDLLFPFGSAFDRVDASGSLLGLSPVDSVYLISPAIRA